LSRAQETGPEHVEEGMPRLLIACLALVAAAVCAAPAAAQDQHSPNMSLVKNIPYEARYGDVPNYGTDVEFATIGPRRYAFAGSEINGLQIVDITRPTSANRVAVLDCAVSQGDTQVFKRGKRTYVTYTNDYEDTEDAAASDCYAQAVAKGFAAVNEDGTAKLGTLIVDVTKPTAPQTVSFVEIEQGSHNMTVHPSGAYLYNSNSDLITSLAPAIEVFDITDLANPVKSSELALATLPGLGTESHDITFNEAGTRAYSAALSHGVVIDTENPAEPSVISEFDDETINVWHQSDPFTVRNEQGEVVRELLIVEDEVAGAAAPGVCPTGGVHVFDVTDESAPQKVGYWNIDDVAVRNPDDTCTAHVFDIHEDEQIMTIAYYMGGVRVVDLSGLAAGGLGIGSGTQGVGATMKQIGFYRTPDSNTWSAKTPVIEPDGSFFLYGNDINRGLDVYRFDGTAQESAEGGTFLSPAAAAAKLAGVPKVDSLEDLRGQRRYSCLLPR
jgi:hypothetical protein